MSVEYRGDDFLYLVDIDGTESRIFNQTDGSSSIEADSIELETKDKTGADYGNVTETVSIEGVLTEGDPAIDYIKQSIRRKRLVRITELNTRELSTETGYYKLDSFEQTNSNGEFATYSLEATLNGSISEGELTEIPEGAPETGDSDNGDGDGVEG
jgi:TP901-1 family phage major tail protein